MKKLVSQSLFLTAVGFVAMQNEGKAVDFGDNFYGKMNVFVMGRYQTNKFDGADEKQKNLSGHAGLGFNVFLKASQNVHPFVGISADAGLPIRRTGNEDYKFNQFLNVNFRTGLSFKAGKNVRINPYGFAGFNVTQTKLTGISNRNYDTTEQDYSFWNTSEGITDGETLDDGAGAGQYDNISKMITNIVSNRIYDLIDYKTTVDKLDRGDKYFLSTETGKYVFDYFFNSKTFSGTGIEATMYGGADITGVGHLTDDIHRDSILVLRNGAKSLYTDDNGVMYGALEASKVSADGVRFVDDINVEKAMKEKGLYYDPLLYFNYGQNEAYVHLANLQMNANWWNDKRGVDVTTDFVSENGYRIEEGVRWVKHSALSDEDKSIIGDNWTREDGISSDTTGTSDDYLVSTDVNMEGREGWERVETKYQLWNVDKLEQRLKEYYQYGSWEKSLEELHGGSNQGVSVHNARIRQAEYIKGRITSLEDGYASLNNSIATLKQDISKIGNELEASNGRNSKLINDVKTQLTDFINKNNSGLTATELQSIRDQLSALKDTTDTLNSNVPSDLLEQLNALKEKDVSLGNSIEDLLGDIASYEDTIKGNLLSMGEVIMVLKESIDNKASNDDVSELQANISALEDAMKQLNNSSRSDYDSLRIQIKNINRSYSGTESTVQGLSYEIDKIKRELSAKSDTAEVEELKELVEELQAQLEEYKYGNSGSQQSRDVQNKLTTLEWRLRMLEIDNAMNEGRIAEMRSLLLDFIGNNESIYGDDPSFQRLKSYLLENNGNSIDEQDDEAMLVGNGAKQTRIGVNLGAGVDVVIKDRFIIGAEYQYSNLSVYGTKLESHSVGVKFGVEFL